MQSRGTWALVAAEPQARLPGVARAPLETSVRGGEERSEDWRGFSKKRRDNRSDARRVRPGDSTAAKPTGWPWDGWSNPRKPRVRGGDKSWPQARRHSTPEATVRVC